MLYLFARDILPLSTIVAPKNHHISITPVLSKCSKVWSLYTWASSARALVDFLLISLLIKKVSVPAIVAYLWSIAHSIDLMPVVKAEWGWWFQCCIRWSEPLFFIAQVEFVIGGEILSVITNFLTNRKQPVAVDGCFSAFVYVVSGLPQGNVLPSCSTRVCLMWLRMNRLTMLTLPPCLLRWSARLIWLRWRTV